MTPQEALCEIQTNVYRNTDDYEIKISKDCYKGIVTALEKQISEKPNIEGDGYDDKGELIYDTAVCPNCEHEFDLGYDEQTKCCPNCGQALDWGEE